MKVRKSNFELMRIISMFLVVLCHIVGHGGLLNPERYGNQAILIFFRLLFLFVIMHINSFILLSGYFQCDKEFKLNKLLALIDSTIFYRVIIMVVFVILGFIQISAVNILRAIFPIPVTEYWFIQCYLFLYMLSPFINIIIKNIDKKTYLKLLLTLLLILSVVPIISNQQIFKNDGYTLYNFVFLYLIGGYLRNYPVNKNFIFKKFSKRAYQITLILLIIFSVVINYSFNYTTQNLIDISPLFSELFEGIYNSQYFYNNPILIVQAISYFLLFESFSFKSKFINKISKCMFGVYLIHDHRLVRESIYSLLSIKTNKIIYSCKFIPYVLFCAIIIFMSCLIVEFIRQVVINFIKKRTISKKISNKFYTSMNEITVDV